MQSRCAGAAGTDRYTSPVEITADDIAWFRACRSFWGMSERGAPAVIPERMRPEEVPEVRDPDRARETFSGGLLAAFNRLERTLCAFFVHSRFVSGVHTLAPPVLPSEAFPGAPELDRFEVSADHVRVFRETNWRTWNIDTKRPYGRSTYYEADIARILGMPGPPNKGEPYPAETEARLRALHHDMLFVLQAYLQHAELEPGQYLIPFDGWDTWIRPRCEPATRAEMDAYVRAIEQIDRQTSPSDQVDPRFKAAALLFGPLR